MQNQSMFINKIRLYSFKFVVEYKVIEQNSKNRFADFLFFMTMLKRV